MTLFLIIVFVIGVVIYFTTFEGKTKQLGIADAFGKRSPDPILPDLNWGRNPFTGEIRFYSTEPRNLQYIEYSLSTLDDDVVIKADPMCQLLMPEEWQRRVDELNARLAPGDHYRTPMERHGELTYLHLYDVMQEKIEGVVDALLRQMLDTLVATIPSEAALDDKARPIISNIVMYGLDYKDPADNDQKTVGVRFKDFLVDFEKKYTSEMKQRGETPKVMFIPDPTKFTSDAPLKRGLQRILMENYGVYLLLLTMSIEPTDYIREARRELRADELRREKHLKGLEFIKRQIKEMIEVAPGKEMSVQDARELVMLKENLIKKSVEEKKYEIGGLDKILGALERAIASRGKSDLELVLATIERLMENKKDGEKKDGGGEGGAA